ncbi:MAG: RNA polymerase sigma factor [Candidatus Pacebacteria bacterium]|nr:RNA polymerase sigma factor [Candidatus Paceibacterota bacterium]
MAEHSDEEVALQVQRGQTWLFSVLIGRYEAKMIRYAQRFLFGYDDVQDLVQEVFIKAYTNIKSFDATRKFSPWLYRIAHNEFINAIKKRGKEPVTFFDPDTLFPHPVYEGGEKDTLDDMQVKKMLEISLDRLDPKYREPLVLYYYEEADYQAISDIMRIPISTVGIRLKRGREALKKIVDEVNPHYEHDK